jgi:hypothetical protein
VARYVCLVCFRSLSSLPGDCPHCSAPRLSLDDPEVRAEVRAEAEKRLQKRMAREYALISFITLVLSLPFVLLVRRLVYLLMPLAALGVSWAYPRVRRGSAIATYAARRQRIGRELGMDVQVKMLADPSKPVSEGGRLLAQESDAAIADLGGPDPDTLALGELLQYLGARLEE